MSKSKSRVVAKKKARAKPTAFAPGEHVRIVPLHYPKPSVSIDEMGRLRGEAAETDLFDGQPHVAPATAHLTYNNGPLLTGVQVFTIFWGTKWSGAAATTIMQNLDKFFQAILVSPLLQQLQEYSVPGQSIGPGSFIGTRVITANAPVGSVTDSTGRKSCQNYCGYHDAVGKIYYAVMPYPTCAGCLGGMAAFDALTGTSSHELCEAITDPVPGAGWYDDVNGEIGDICAWNFKKIDGYTVQMEWSNAHSRCV